MTRQLVVRATYRIRLCLLLASLFEIATSAYGAAPMSVRFGHRADPVRGVDIASTHEWDEPRVESSWVVGREEQARHYEALRLHHEGIAAEVAQVTGKIERVLYPMARNDIASPLQVFTTLAGSPTELWMVDLHPFGRASRVAGAFSDSAAKVSYFQRRRYTNVTVPEDAWSSRQYGNDGVGASLLWELEKLGARAVTVDYLDSNGSVLSANALDRVTHRENDTVWSFRQADLVKEGNIIRPTVRLRFVLEGKPRSVFYVEHEIGQEPMPPLLHRFVRGGYDALFQRWAGGGIGMATARAFSGFIQTAMAGLRRGGVVLTDDPAWRKAARVGTVPLVERHVLGEAHGFSSGKARTPPPILLSRLASSKQPIKTRSPR